MNLYISDLHFGHKNIIGFDHRPFSDVDEMDHTMIQLWNGRVFDDDHVYIIGDIMHRSGRSASWYLRRLKGHKHLVIGNHDQVTLNEEKAMSYFESVDKMMQVEDTFEGERIQICLCHYPMVSWYKSHHGTWLIYGHIHNRKEFPYDVMKNMDRALNAGACINNYTPVSFRELYLNNLAYREGECS